MIALHFIYWTWTPLILAFWLVILPKGIPIYVSPVLGFQSAACRAYTAFSWVLGTETPVLVLVCQTLYYWVTSMTPELVLNVLFVPHLPLSLSSDPSSFQKLYLFTGANVHLIACVWRPEKDLQEAVLSSATWVPLQAAASTFTCWTVRCPHQTSFWSSEVRVWFKQRNSKRIRRVK